MSLTTSENGAVTTQYDFCGVNRNGDCLFSVRAGVPLSDALDKLTVLIANASSVMDDVATTVNAGEIPYSARAGVELLDIAYALIQSIHLGHNEFENGGAEK